jgi:hypothetical protein
MEKAKNKTYESRVVTPALHTAQVLSCLQPHQRTWTKKGTQALKEAHGIDSHMVRNVESSKPMLTMASLLTVLVQVKKRAVTLIALNNYEFQETKQSKAEMQTNERSSFNNEDPHYLADFSVHS